MRDASILADRVIERLQNKKARTAILVFDACRNNPLETDAFSLPATYFVKFLYCSIADNQAVSLRREAEGDRRRTADATFPATPTPALRLPIAETRPQFREGRSVKRVSGGWSERSLPGLPCGKTRNCARSFGEG